jgi:hypothetical protein
VSGNSSSDILDMRMRLNPTDAPCPLKQKRNRAKPPGAAAVKYWKAPGGTYGL